MRELRVNRASNNLTANFLELFSLIAECNNLCWTNKGKIEWVEEKNKVLPFKIR